MAADADLIAAREKARGRIGQGRDVAVRPKGRGGQGRLWSGLIQQSGRSPQVCGRTVSGRVAVRGGADLLRAVREPAVAAIATLRDGGRVGGGQRGGVAAGVRNGQRWECRCARGNLRCQRSSVAGRWRQAAAAVARELCWRRAAGSPQRRPRAGPRVRGEGCGLRLLIRETHAFSLEPKQADLREPKQTWGAGAAESGRGRRGADGPRDAAAQGQPRRGRRGLPRGEGRARGGGRQNCGKGRACSTPRRTAVPRVASGQRRRPRAARVGPREPCLGESTHLGLVALGGPARVHAAARRASSDASAPGRLHRAPHASRGRWRGPLATVARRARHHWTARSSRGCAGVLRGKLRRG